MEKFAEYGFNRSHSAAYSLVAYHTAYLKAHYPAEYMASVLSHNQNNIDKITQFMEEAKRMGIKVIGPDVNESDNTFTVNKKGEILFGLAAIKGTGDAAVEAIIAERNENGSYKDVFDFSSRVNLRSVNKKTFEALAMSGAFDCFGNYHRRQYLYDEDENGNSLIEKAIKFGNKKQYEKDSNQQSLFGAGQSAEFPPPKVESCEPFSEIEKLKMEKEVVGFYISGHPLDQYKFEIKHFCNAALGQLKNMEPLVGRNDIYLAGIVVNFSDRFTKSGKPFGTLSLEDYDDSHTFYLFGDDYLKFKKYFISGLYLYIRGKVERLTWRNNEPDFKIINIDLLSDIRNKYCDGIKINITAGSIDESVVEKLATAAENNKGKSSLIVNIIDESENIAVDLFSRKLKVSSQNDFIEVVESIPGAEIELMIRH